MPTILEELAGVYVRHTSYSELDAVTRIIVPFFLSLDVFFVKDITTATLLAVTALVFLLWAGVPLRFLKNYLFLILSLSFFIVLSFVFFKEVPGNTLYSTTILRVNAERGVWEWKILITDTALLQTAFFILRILAMIFTATLFIATVSDRDIVWGLRRLKLPAWVSISASLFFRGISFFVSDFLIVREAMIARGVDFEKSSLARKFRIYLNALIPLLSLMVTRSLEISLALESRGIQPSTTFSASLHRGKLTIKDYLVLAFTVFLTIFLAWWFTWRF
ncbi:MAG: energy-coupling factor transporter transmembrane component T family protein [Infirmifilum sp.]|jgi:energy-coupling factor transport system permease protein|uniref:Energy-coupling factor transporter transmembrane protein EcfT n=1 Tax=Infirmifilum uzonense TaxID=1550241 RepID=A0A0F7FH83_9CREN|nr:energy-coupling factor transporter transmembrane component T [Infirmifilum uzonense]AKG38649.1 hypothetical protein MA03_04225 [Infirmifilum uzonense]